MFAEHSNEGNGMDEKLQKKLIRQLRAIRFWLGFFGIVLVVGFAFVGFLTFKAFTVVTNAQKSLDSLQTKANQAAQVKNELCSNSLVATSSYCKQ